jgi:hypothetical protein
LRSGVTSALNEGDCPVQFTPSAPLSSTLPVSGADESAPPLDPSELVEASRGSDGSTEEDASGDDDDGVDDDAPQATAQERTMRRETVPTEDSDMPRTLARRVPRPGPREAGEVVGARQRVPPVTTSLS